MFVHAAALQRSGIAKLAEGQRVAMEVAEGRKGLAGCGKSRLIVVSLPFIARSTSVSH